MDRLVPEKSNSHSTGSEVNPKPCLMQKDLENLLGTECDNCCSALLELQKFPDLSADDKSNKRKQIIKFCEKVNRNRDKKYRKICALREPPAGMGVSFELRSGGRLLVDHAGGLLENSNLCLHHLFGFPMIPGSALKGVARAYAEQTSSNAALVDRVFGTEKKETKADIPEEWRKSDHRGDIVFMPAYPADDNWELETDVLTSHTGNNPIPVFFPAVKRETVFKFQLRKISSSVPDEELIAAREWLTGTLTTCGVGAKTSAGYGWFENPDAGVSAAGAADSGEDFDTAEVNKWAISELQNHLDDIQTYSTAAQTDYFERMVKYKSRPLRKWKNNGDPNYQKMEELAKKLGKELPQ